MLPSSISDDFIESIPQPLGLLLREYKTETSSYQKLWRMCDCAEMLLRFIAATFLAEVCHSRSDNQFSDNIKKAILGYGINTPDLGRPTFGTWIEIVKTCFEVIPPSESLVVGGFPQITDAILKIISPPKPSQKNSIYILRNSLAHNARAFFKQADIYLEDHGHQKRFETFWTDEKTIDLFSNIKLWGVVGDNSAILLRGKNVNLKEMKRIKLSGLSGIDLSKGLPCDGSILLSYKDRDSYLSLFPLFYIGKVHQKENDNVRVISEEMATQVYSCNDISPKFIVESST